MTISDKDHLGILKITLFDSDSHPFGNLESILQNLDGQGWYNCDVKAKEGFSKSVSLSYPFKPKIVTLANIPVEKARQYLYKIFPEWLEQGYHMSGSILEGSNARIIIRDNLTVCGKRHILNLEDIYEYCTMHGIKF